MCPSGQFKKLAKHGKFMEESKVQLISRVWRLTWIREMFSSDLKGVLVWGPIWKTCIIYWEDQSRREVTVWNMDNYAIIKELVCFCFKIIVFRVSTPSPPPSAIQGFKSLESISFRVLKVLTIFFISNIIQWNMLHHLFNTIPPWKAFYSSSHDDSLLYRLSYIIKV